MGCSESAERWMEVCCSIASSTCHPSRLPPERRRAGGAAGAPGWLAPGSAAPGVRPVRVRLPRLAGGLLRGRAVAGGSPWFDGSSIPRTGSIHLCVLTHWRAGRPHDRRRRMPHPAPPRPGRRPGQPSVPPRHRCCAGPLPVRCALASQAADGAAVEQLRGVPSGIDASKSIAARQPTTAAIMPARSRMLMSSPLPTFRWVPSGPVQSR